MSVDVQHAAAAHDRARSRSGCWPFRTSCALTTRCSRRSPPAIVRAEDWPQFRGPGGQGASAETGLPLQWSESSNVMWKVPIAGRGWSSPVVAGDRVWLTTAVDEGDVSLRALAFDVETGRQVVNTEVFRKRRALLPEHEEQLGVADADRRRRSRLRALRRRRDRGADDRRRGGLEDALSLRIAARRRRLAGALRRPADLQLRRQRHRVRGGARQADRQGALEDAAAPARRSGLLDAAGDSGRRSRSTGQRRRLPCCRLRSGIRPGDLAGQLRRRLFERAASGVRPRPGLYRDRISGAVAARRAGRRQPAT